MGTTLTRGGHMGVFSETLAALDQGNQPGRWAFIPYDQLSAQTGVLRDSQPADLGLIFCETRWKPSQRPYHKQKLALLLSNQRQFALEMARAGYAVRYLDDDRPYANILEDCADKCGVIDVMEPAEFELRQQLRPLVERGLIRPLPNDYWYTTVDDFRRSQGKHRKWRMDRFYRYIRKKYDVLVDDKGKPEGGKWSHDADNRQPWNGQPKAPIRLRFEPCAIVNEVCEMVATRFADHPGELKPDVIPSTAEHAQRLWEWNLAHCLSLFGPYEDAMSRHEIYLFHTGISSLLNLGRLHPRHLIEDVAALDIPLNSKEGFIRQVIGWREFVRHVHRETDGFRQLDDEFKEAASVENKPSFLGAHNRLPPLFWGDQSGLGCLDHVISEVWEHGYTHHINRLMVLANWATLLDVSPRELSDWFWVAFVDAYDWVVEPNVIGMGTFGVGELMTTKPYVSGSAYINKMSDYCGDCQFQPGKTCPMTSLYWAFLDRHRDRLSGNPRLSLVLGSSRKRAAEKKQEDARVARLVIDTLQRGERLSVERMHEIEMAS